MNYIVIGSNYGDEGKGRATRYIVDKHINDIPKEKMIGIRHNGGAQAGHTSYGFVHHSICSGNIQTYLADTFIYNPFSINQECMMKTINDSKIPYTIYVNENCRITTPIDILMNHVIETIRNKNRHGSCGMGIHATIVRNKTLPMSVGRLIGMNVSQRQKFADLLIHHYHGFEQAVRDIPEQFLDLDLNRMMDDFFDEFDKSINSFEIKILKQNEEKEFLNYFDLRIFEGAQGLLLDKDNKENYPHVTPSKTDSTNPINILKRCELEKDTTYPIYCTRTYLTKHGAGKFPTKEFEATTMEIIKQFDSTNIPNDWQGAIRCGYLDSNWKKRTEDDFQKYEGFNVDIPRYFLTWWDVSNGNSLFCENNKIHKLASNELFNINEIENNQIECKKINHKLDLLYEKLINF